MTARRALATVTVAALAAGAGTGSPASGQTAHVKRPKPGQYIGQTHQKNELTLVVSGKRVRTAVAELKCTYFRARLEVHHLKLRKTKRGYAFALHARRKVNYTNHQPAQRLKVDVTGRFARTGTRARGRVRVKSQRCGKTGYVRWTAKHVNHPVKTPRSGQYGGKTAEQRDIFLYTSDRSIDLAEIHFRCTDSADGVTGLNSVPMRRTAEGYAFSIRAHGSVTYNDGQPDENAEVDLIGRFARTGRTATGHIRVKSPRCGGTGRVAFSVRFQKSS